jgi:hypothetical protein
MAKCYFIALCHGQDISLQQRQQRSEADHCGTWPGRALLCGIALLSDGQLQNVSFEVHLRNIGVAVELDSRPVGVAQIGSVPLKIHLGDQVRNC